jgi:hypothetical protein
MNRTPAARQYAEALGQPKECCFHRQGTFQPVRQYRTVARLDGRAPQAPAAAIAQNHQAVEVARFDVTEERPEVDAGPHVERRQCRGEIVIVAGNGDHLVSDKLQIETCSARERGENTASSARTPARVKRKIT